MIIAVTRCDTCQQICRAQKERHWHFKATGHKSFSSKDEEIVDVTCKTCAHWEPNERSRTDGTGYCDAAWRALHDQSHTLFIIEAYAADDHGLEARLCTGPDFGCVHHSPVK